MFIFCVFCALQVYCRSISVEFERVYQGEVEQSSYFKSLFMRNFLGSGYEVPILNLLDSQYFVSVSIGNPHQVFKLVPDIFTTVSWVPSNSCWSLSCFLHSLYKHSESSTYSPTSEKFSQFYGSGKVSGFYSNDYIELQNTEFQLTFGEATRFEGPSWLTARFDGVLSLHHILLQLMSENKDYQSKIELKKIKNSIKSVIGQCEDEYEFLPADQNKFFQVGEIDVLIGDKVKINDVKLVFDLQTPLIVVDEKMFEEFFKDLRIENNCGNFLDLPVIVFETQGVRIKITPQDYVLRTGDECLIGIMFMEFPGEWENVIVLGDVVLKKHQLCFDWESSKLGIRPN